MLALYLRKVLMYYANTYKLIDNKISTQVA